MRKVAIESPLAASDMYTQEQHQEYARYCVLDCLQRGEAPYASHLLFTQMLDDTDPDHRELGIRAGLKFTSGMARVFYADLCKAAHPKPEQVSGSDKVAATHLTLSSVWLVAGGLLGSLYPTLVSFLFTVLCIYLAGIHGLRAVAVAVPQSWMFSRGMARAWCVRPGPVRTLPNDMWQAFRDGETAYSFACRTGFGR